MKVVQVNPYWWAALYYFPFPLALNEINVLLFSTVEIKNQAKISYFTTVLRLFFPKI